MSESENSSTAASQSQCDKLAAAVLRYCEANHFKIAAAESLTGGLLADAFVRIPGASKVFLGSAVTYDIRAKAKILGVNADLLAREGAVHPEVARQMAAGTAQLYRQTEDGDCVIGLATTGVAGPGPDGDKPAGLVYIGCSLPCGFNGIRARQTAAYELRLKGDREAVRHETVQCILEKLGLFQHFHRNNPRIWVLTIVDVRMKSERGWRHGHDDTSPRNRWNSRRWFPTMQSGNARVREPHPSPAPRGDVRPAAGRCVPARPKRPKTSARPH